MLGDKVVLDVDKFASLVDPFEGMAAISVIKAPALGSSVIAEEHEAGVVGLRGVGEQIKEGIKIEEKVPGVTTLRANHIGTLNGISTEEYGLQDVSSSGSIFGPTICPHKVESDNVIVALRGVKLDGKSARVPPLVWELAAKSHGREPHKDGRLLPAAGQEVGFLRSIRSFIRLLSFTEVIRICRTVSSVTS